MTARARQSWKDVHLIQLSCSHDFFGDAFGRLHELPDEKLPGVLVDMQACWRKHREEIEAMAAEHNEPAWFGQYADHPERLITQILADPMRPQNLKWAANASQ